MAQDERFEMSGLLAEFADDSLDILKEMASIYLEEVPSVLNRLRGGYAAGDWEAVARAAHSLANNLGTLGYHAAVDDARAVEQAARTNRTSPPADLIDRLAARGEEVRTVLGDWLADS